MRKIIKVIDTISEYSGKTFRWTCVALVLVLAYEVMMRHVFDSPTTWVHLTSIMLGGTIVFMGYAYTHLHHGHIRIDVFYGKLSPRWKAITDILGDIFILFPLLGMLIQQSFFWMWRSWVTHEVRIESWWYPPAAPFRTVMLVGLCLFTLQAIAEFLREIHLLVRSKPYD